MKWARILGATGRTLIWIGSIILLFVVYQLWGTNLAEARSQNGLESEFEALLDSFQPTSTTTNESPATTIAPTTTTTQPLPPPDDGEALARIVIPKIGVDKIVVEGVRRNDLKKGPGHYPGTPLPGQKGNASIAGHRTTYGAPFNRIDELQPGDEILVTTLQGSFKYVVTGQQIVAPSQTEVIDDQGDNRLTLTSCHPKFSARERIIVSAVLQAEPAPTTPTGPVDIDEIPTEDLSGDGDLADRESLDAAETKNALPAVMWAFIVLAVWVAFFALSKEWRKWPSFVLGAAPFLVALFFFFENLSNLLPSNF